VPPHEPEYQYQFELKPSKPPVNVRVEDEPEITVEGVADAEVAAVEFTITTVLPNDNITPMNIDVCTLNPSKMLTINPTNVNTALFVVAINIAFNPIFCNFDISNSRPITNNINIAPKSIIGPNMFSLLINPSAFGPIIAPITNNPNSIGCLNLDANIPPISAKKNNIPNVMSSCSILSQLFCPLCFLFVDIHLI